MHRWLMTGIFCAMITVMEAAPAPFELQKPDFKTYDFEDEKVPAEFTPGPGSRLGVSSDIYKSGRKSLRWDWDCEDAYILYKNAEAFRHLTGENPDPIVYEWVTFCSLSTFSMWVFSEKELGGQLNATFQPKSDFYVNMNFEGWRPVQLMYGRDLAVFPGNADTLIIRAPKGVAKGTLYIDDFAPRRELDVRFVTGSPQQPYVQVRPGVKEEKKIERIDIVKPAQLTADQIKLLDRLGNEFFKNYRITGSKYKLSEKDFNNLLANRQRFKISRSGRFVNGQVGHPMHFYGAWSGIARAYHLADINNEQRKELLDLIIDMADLVIQQGHSGRYPLRTSFIAPVTLMRKELEEAGRYDQLIERLRGITEINGFYEKVPRGDADFYNTALLAAYGTILMQSDKARQWQDLEALHHWLGATNRNGELLADGTFSHHCMVYIGYGFPAIGPLCTVLYYLRGTQFFDEEMYELAKLSIMAMSFYSNPYAPHMFAGRWRVCGQFDWGMAVCLDLMARCRPQVDKELAARYLHYADYYKKSTPEADAYRKAGITADPMNGALAQNYAISLIHRRGVITSTVRGQRNGLFANEIYAFQAGNTMGRYLNYGQLQIMDVTPAKSGFVMNKGWDFNHWPGTTARVIPFEALRQKFENVEAQTREYFAGATALDGNGMWAMKLQEELPLLDDPLRIGPPIYFLGQKEYEKRCKESLYDTGFRARKSMFFFDDRIIALGSGIESSDGAPVATTLFQNSLEKPEELSRKYKAGNAVWFMSSTGHGYYVAPGNGEVIFERNFMKKPFHSHWLPKNPEFHNKIEPNEGNMELAYINHGGNAKNAGYEYCIFVKTDAEKLERLAKKPPYQVLQRDTRAHIVKDAATGTIGYAMFEAGDGLEYLKSVNDPCLIMIKKKLDGNLLLSVFNPRYDAPEKALQDNIRTELVLNGDWKLAVNHDQVKSSGKSGFIVTNRNMMPVEFELTSGK